MNSIQLSRKKFIGGSLIGLFLFTTTAWVLKSFQKTVGLFFGPREEDVLRSFAKAILPDSEGFPDVRTAQVIERLDEEFFFLEESISGDFALALSLLEYLPVRFGYWNRFSRLTPEETRTFLKTALEDESEFVRLVVSSVRMAIFLVYYGHKSTWKTIGYDGPFGNFPETLSESRIYYKNLIRKK
ncbi:hypothetical protein EHQ12_04365 [Leptospira gomenensis]|uniref:Gluconate 2-dehydrogenase subunit 3 family protein n=1 Tax=Leptospira gomenensis TaxID=2484974 RepID=A0A5F1YRQ0_9LEPT|nr:hypothetical protein [Leptospira gomenensis]TGK38611.1 hypothetical protein EHQ17_00795 [Leptospira gomenensis]TGK42848.1 hypothetical protein EHQ12_04365 [Leptospira gomenensis]TGK49607.1 hypothetical protein EHQ07_04810 [Leptospira gomenensis]TGK60723.1 hypothetical protein EHQ13_10260 [Leptospira gomenensis]